MGLERIYFELKKREDDEYYIELAQKDVLFVPVITDIMLNNSNSISVWAQMLLEKISEKNPLIVYPYIGYISEIISTVNRRKVSSSKYCMGRSIGYPLYL